MLEESSGSSQGAVGTVRGRPGKVKEEKSRWRTLEDHELAYKLQEEEFCDHYDHNRSERRQVGGDLRKTKEEQELEDKYAEEYWEQVRRDRETEDERIAREIQLEVEKEEREKLRMAELQDQEIAKKVQKKEARKIRYDEERMQELANEDERVAKQLEEYLRMSSEGGTRVSGVSSEDWGRMRRERREGRRVELPPGMSPEQEAAIREALREEDARLAQEAQDLELARLLQRKEEKRLKKLASEEQIDNEMNQAAALIRPSKQVSRELKKDNEKDLISFDEEPPGGDVSTTNPFLNGLPVAAPPPRPPPPNLNRKKLSQNDSSMENSTGPNPARNVVAMGGVRVLPPVLPKDQ